MVPEVGMFEIDKISKRVIETTLKITNIRKDSMGIFADEFLVLFQAYGVELTSFLMGKTITFVKDGLRATVEYDPVSKEYFVVPTRGGEPAVGVESHPACIEFVKTFISIEEEMVEEVKASLIEEGLSIEATTDVCGIPMAVCANYIDEVISAFVVIPMDESEHVCFFAKVR